MGLFDRFKKDTAQDAKDNILKYLSEINDTELQELIQYVTKNPDFMEKTEENPDILKYLNLIGSLFDTNYVGGLQKQRDRDYYYRIYDEMDESTAYITAALDILSDDASQPDDRGRILVVESESQKVVSLLENMLDDLEIGAKLSRWIRSVAKYGDLFLKVHAEEGEGIVSIDDTIYPSYVSKIDFRGKTLAFTEESDLNFGVSKDDFLPPWDYVHFRHKGEVLRDHRNQIIDNMPSKFTAVYGQSVLRGAIKVYSQLRFVENLMILSRLTNSIRRNVFLINVGQLDPGNAFESIRNYANLLKKNIHLDIDEDIFNSQRHRVQYDEDIFIPVSDPMNDVRIETIGGDVNIAEQYDVEYLLNKLFSSLKIPKAYLNYEQDLNARSTLIQLDIRYARSVAQLQNTMLSGLDRLARIHLAYHGLNPDAIDFTFILTSVSAIDEEARLEARSQKVDAAADMWDLLTTMNSTLTDLREEGISEPTNAGSGVDFGLDNDFPRPTEPPAPDLELPVEGEFTPPEEPEGVEEPESYADFARETTESVNPRLREGKDELPEFSIDSDSPIDMAVAAEIILRDYLGFDSDEVSKLLRLDDPNSDLIESATKYTRLHESSRLHKKRSYIRDLDSAYPSESGWDEFNISVSRLRDLLIESEEGTKSETIR